MTDSIRVIIYEDQPKIRESLAFLLGSPLPFPGSQPVKLMGAFPHTDNLRNDLVRLRPDVILMDIEMPGHMDGVAATAIVRTESPDTNVVMYTQFDDSDHVFRALQNGARGYLLKSSPIQDVVDAIGAVHRGGSLMSPSIGRKLVDFFQKLPPQVRQSPDQHGLSDREMDVLRLLAAGHGYKQIAAELFISVDTVRSHIRKIYEKLEVHSKSEAVRKAYEMGVARVGG